MKAKLVRIGSLLFVLLVLALFVAPKPALAAPNCAFTSQSNGNWSSPGTWSILGSGCDTYPGQTLSIDTVTIANPYTVTLDTNPSFAILSLTVNSGGTLNVAGYSITVTHATIVSGALNITSAAGTKIFTELVTVNTGGTWNNSGNSAVTFRGGITNNSTFTAGTGIHTFDTNSQTLTGTFSIPSVTVNGVTLTNSNTLTVATALSGTGGLTQAASAALNIGGDPTSITTLTATASGNTVNYNGGPQAVKATTYNNLTLSGSQNKMFNATNITVNGILSLEGTAYPGGYAPAYGTNATLQYNTATARDAGTEWISPFVASGGVVISNTGAITLVSSETNNSPLTINSGATLITNGFNLTFLGNFIDNGTLTAGSSSITMDGTATQSISGFTTTGTVYMTKTGGTATFTGNVTGGPLILTNGNTSNVPTLNLGTGLTHSFTSVTLTWGTLNGGSSTLNVSGNCSQSNGVFTAGTSTVNWNGAGAQALCDASYYNLTLSNANTKTWTRGAARTVSGDLTIAGTAQFSLQGNYTLNAGGNWTDSSTNTTPFTTTANAASIVNFNKTGTSTLSKTTGAGLTETFCNLTIGTNTTLDTTDDFVAVSNAAGCGTLTTNGVFKSEPQSVNVTNGGGAVTFTDALNNPTVVLTQTSGSDMGSTTVIVTGHVVSDTTSFPCGSTTLGGRPVLRYFNISPTNTTSVAATLRLYWRVTGVDETNTNTPTTVTIFHCTPSTGAWERLAGTYARGGPVNGYDWVELPNVTTFSPFVVGGGPGDPTAVTLSSFTTRAGSDTLLASAIPLPALLGLAVGALLLMGAGAMVVQKKSK